MFLGRYYNLVILLATTFIGCTFSSSSSPLPAINDQDGDGNDDGTGTPGPGGTPVSAPTFSGANCVGDTLSTHISDLLNLPEFIHVGVTRATNESVPLSTSGPLVVTVNRPGTFMLAGSSYGAVHWTINAGPDTHIERIFISGFYRQTVTAPGGIPLQNRSYEVDGPFWGSSQAEDTDAFWVYLQAAAGRQLTAYAGCNQMSQITID